MGEKKKKILKKKARIRRDMAALLESARSGTGLNTQSKDLESVSKPRTRGRQKAPTKIPVSLRLDPDVVEELRKGGPGWQTRLNAILRERLLPKS